MDIFLDLTGTLTDMESEDYAMLKLAEKIKKRFSLDMDAEEILRRIEEYRKPYMDKRHISYTPIRFLVLEAVRRIVPKRLCANDSYWIIDEYSSIHAKYVKLAPNALEGLKILRKIARHMGLITDADRPFTDRLLSSLKIVDFFDSVTTAEDVGIGKPNPRIFQEAMKKGTSNIRIYIGDSEKRDISGAKNVGMIAIKIGGDSRLADYVAKDLMNAARFIQTLETE